MCPGGRVRPVRGLARRVARGLWCVCFLLAVVQPACGGERPVFTPVEATQGLSSNKVRSIVQLPDGRMAFMTEGQLNLYDGTDFRYLHYGRGHLCRLSDYSGYHHVYLDAHGYLWIKNSYWLMAVDIGRECFVEHPERLLARRGINVPIRDLFMDKGQGLWVVTEQDDLLRVDKDSLQASVFLRGVSPDNDQVYDLGVLENKLYLFYRSGLLVCYDLASRQELYRQEYLKDLPEGLYGRTSFVVLGKRAFYQLCNGAKGGVMLSYDIHSRQWRTVLHTAYWFNYLSIDRDGSIWVSGYQGLWKIDGDMERVQHIPTLKLVDGQKIDSEVSTLYNDVQGGMWAGTQNRGILYYHPDRFRFRNIGRALFPIPGHEPLNILALREGEDGRMLLKTERETFVYNPSTEELSACNQEVWPEEASPSDGEIPGLPEPPVQVVCMGGDSLAGITRKGWFVHDKGTGKTTYHPVCHYCNAISACGRERIWVGLEDGLLLCEVPTGRQRMFYTSDGLVNNSIRSILQTADSVLWLSTASGISRLTVDGEGEEARYSFVNYNRFDGVITGEFCNRSACIASDGTLYWGGVDGFNRLGPLSAVEGQARYVPLFVGFNLFGKPVEGGKAYHGNVILERPITMTREIVLEYDQNFFGIEFSALNYINPTQTYYRYCLEGIDRAEQEIRSSDGKGYVAYTDIPPGNYTFRVRAAGNGKSWTDQYAELHIQVRAPFWQTGYAYVCYALLVSGCIVCALLLYLRAKRRNLVREQKEKLDEMKATFLQNMNRELKGPVEQILSPIDDLLRHTDEGRYKLQLQGVRSQAAELKELVAQLSEGVLLPLPADENVLELDALIVNMRNLLEQQERRREQADKNRVGDAGEGLLSEADEAFIRKALQFVEQNLDNPQYSVEVLSRDMGMDRTGLYRRLVAVAGKTPTSFIRSVRLKRAAILLEKGYTVAEVADGVGFSTSSYLSKCFQEEFGMRPSQYVEQMKKKR